MRSRISKTAAAAAVVLGGVLVTAAASGAPPDTPPVGATQPVREQNLDASGRIKVHELHRLLPSRNLGLLRTMHRSRVAAAQPSVKKSTAPLSRS